MAFKKLSLSLGLRNMVASHLTTIPTDLNNCIACYLF